MSELAFKTKTAKQRHQQVLKAIDAIASKDQLAFITTKRVSIESGISDGVLFRIFPSKESMLDAWLDSRGEHLRNILKAAPIGHQSLRKLIQRILNDSTALSFLYCHPMDTPYLRQQLEHYRAQFRRFLHTRIELMHDSTWTLPADALTDHLIQSIYRAWDPENPERNKHKEQLMQQLPWQQVSTSDHLFPTQEVIQRLALNDSGFVFDPESGRSFTANVVGLYVLRFLQSHDSADALFESIEADFDVNRSDAERDITEFSAQLREFLA
ncbi:MAG: PqqD family peptide modification chaperone [Mariprofundaceae bacterium]|nr:PqqD family peptide modification chaperone [Mariprofundaceae bacterium]